MLPNESISDASNHAIVEEEKSAVLTRSDRWVRFGSLFNHTGIADSGSFIIITCITITSPWCFTPADTAKARKCQGL